MTMWYEGALATIVLGGGVYYFSCAIRTGVNTQEGVVYALLGLFGTVLGGAAVIAALTS
jgi:hypothetical protein